MAAAQDTQHYRRHPLHDAEALSPAAAELRQPRRSCAAGAAQGSATTPLRRISRGSLVALSASRTRESDMYGPTLGHLAPAFAELAEAIEDLAVNMEALDAIDQSLDDFNESFGGLLVGLRVNAYTSDFLQAPTLRNFAHGETRQRLLEQQTEAAEEAARLADEAEEAARKHNVAEEHALGGNEGDETFLTQPGESDSRPTSSRGGLNNGRGRGRGGGTAVGGTTRVAAKKQKEMLIKFAQPIISSMPIDFREKQPQRTDAETIIGALRTHPNGLRVQELVKMYPSIPQHRINDCLLALVRAKHAIKVTSKGLLYRLDPLKYPVNS